MKVFSITINGLQSGAQVLENNVCIFLPLKKNLNKVHHKWWAALDIKLRQHVK